MADDAQTNRIILKNLLEDAGHHVELVENGRDLLERIMGTSPSASGHDAPFDLVLTDIQMPIMDGITATQNFRKLEREVTPRQKATYCCCYLLRFSRRVLEDDRFGNRSHHYQTY